MGRQKIMNQMVASLFPIYWLLISPCMQFLLVGVITKNLYFATFSMALPDSYVT
jgi:hypothetical protein